MSERPSALLVSLLTAILVTGGSFAQEKSEDESQFRFDASFEAKVHYRDSETARFALAFGFSPDQLPPGADQAFLETVNAGSHLEASVVSLHFDAAWGESLTGRVKIDFIDLYDRNPTSGDRTIDVDEVWIRFGRETPNALLPDRPGAYLTVGKIPKFERQDDRHLESYGLVSTAFNRFEDMGLELGVDLGRFLYLKATATQGNPVFMRDPHALAGDNGTDVFREANPDPVLKSGIPIIYDAEVEDLDADGELELGAGLGARWADDAGVNGFEILLFGYRRDLADTVELEGTFYGGDLDLLLGPGNATPFPITSDVKEEVGVNVWVYLGGFTGFGQFVDQEIAGLARSGWETELAWRLDLPLRWALAGRQLFPWVAPAVRYSELDPEFGNPNGHPAPSFTWKWKKLDLGARIGIIEGTDLTLEYSDSTFVLANGREVPADELLATLRFRM